jgi:hypothetical protein
MKRINIGVANLVVSNMLKESHFKKNVVTETEFEKSLLSNAASNLLEVVKGSPLLQLEFKVFNSIENKNIQNKELAPRYIDNNIKLFEIYTFEELQEEHKKLEPFIGEDEIVSDKAKLYESITVLIEESLKVGSDVDVDEIHEAFDTVLAHLTKPKEEKSKVPEHINEQVIEMAINKFNEKYENMTSEEVDLFKKLVASTVDEKKGLFEEYKKENVRILETLQKENNNEKITKSLEKINEMKFNPKEADSNIVKLFELKRGLE